MRSNAKMANRQGEVDLREAQVSAPQLTFWLGLEVLRVMIVPLPTRKPRFLRLQTIISSVNQTT